MRSSRETRAITWALAIAAILGLPGCGGGGGGGSTTPPPTNNPAPATAQNLLPIIIDAGPAHTVNTPFVSVTICAPATSNCQTIDHVIVDTASTGLRIMSSVLSPSLALVQQTTSNGSPLVECVQFAGSYSWGPMKAAGVKLGGESIDSLAIQVIGDTDFPDIPSSCSSSGPAANTVQAVGGNGILGVGVFQQDCGPLCAHAPVPGTYYSCTGATCQAAAVDLATQIQNPVGLLATNNNGVVVDLPAVGATGATAVSGSLILGIGTQSNNSLGNAVVFALDSNTGTFTTIFEGQTYASSFIDSGSNALFFPSGAVTVCSSGFYCPASTQQLTATNQGTNGSSGTVDFSVANADSLLNTNNVAFSNLGAPPFASSGFDWGLPFHFGRRVFTAIKGRNSPGGTGPYVAY